MPDIIHLLPDSVANQIAAGEVIQRPASAVKELLENAVDSGADEITLHIKDAGKQLIQVIDNGCGMSETDARMCLERHATSKIKTANDLFAIKTLGFRGEALASMAAIAQLELKSKKVEDELGTLILVEGSQVKSQEPCASRDGTSITIKNLFYNIPARRKFLKSNTTELRHIIEEFQRVALVYPQIKFSFFNENRQLFMLAGSNLKQRIVALFGNAFNNRLVQVDQQSDVVSITGFIGKPEFARKTRGEQYFFVNGRFIKHPYLNHAVDGAFSELIPKDAYPTYFIYFSIDPKEIDINIHPTKTEINFQNNQVIYAMLSAAIKQALGKFNVQSLDFDMEPSLDFNPPKKGESIQQPKVNINPTYNPFHEKNTGSSFSGYKPPARQKTEGWEKLYDQNSLKPSQNLTGLETTETSPVKQTNILGQEEPEKNFQSELVFQLHNKYIVTSVKSGLLIIDQQRAHERVLYEHFLKSLDSGKGVSQQELFPTTIEFSAGDTEILKSILPELKTLGFDLDEFGENTFIVNGTPADMNNHPAKDVLENIIENYKKQLKTQKIDKNINLARSLAVNMAIGDGKRLEREEILSIIDRLFACNAPEVSPDGKPVLRILTLDEFNQMFN